MESTVWLTKDQMASLRAKLERARDELRSVEEQATASNGETPGTKAPHDVERSRLRLAIVRSALMRLENGTYGECVRCEEPLAFEVLSKRPEAALCQACEAERRSTSR